MSSGQEVQELDPKKAPDAPKSGPLDRVNNLIETALKANFTGLAYAMLADMFLWIMLTLTGKPTGELYRYENFLPVLLLICIALLSLNIAIKGGVMLWGDRRKA